MLSVEALRARHGGGGWSCPSLSSGRIALSRRVRLGFRRGCTSCAWIEMKRQLTMLEMKGASARRREHSRDDFSGDPLCALSDRGSAKLLDDPLAVRRVLQQFCHLCSRDARFVSLDRVEAGKGEGYLRIRAAAGC